MRKIYFFGQELILKMRYIKILGNTVQNNGN